MASTASPPANTAASAKPVITPDHSLDHRMHVDKKIVDEILLVCGVLGSTDEATGNFVPVEDCLNWLQDLQRALRRDDDLYRPISLLLGQWKVVEQKLLPLVLSCRYDTAMVLTICKILVILTKPLAENTARAGKMVIDVKKKNEKR
jgi:timeless